MNATKLQDVTKSKAGLQSTIDEMSALDQAEQAKKLAKQDRDRTDGLAVLSKVLPLAAAGQPVDGPATREALRKVGWTLNDFREHAKLYADNVLAAKERLEGVDVKGLVAEINKLQQEIVDVRLNNPKRIGDLRRQLSVHTHAQLVVRQLQKLGLDV